MFERLEPDPRDDIYALACVSYEVLTGEHRFARASAPEAREAGMQPPRVAGLSREQNRSLQRGLSFDRASRTGSASGFYEALYPGAPNKRRGTLTALVGILAMTVLAVWIYLGGPIPDLPLPATGTPAAQDAERTVEPAGSQSGSPPAARPVEDPAPDARMEPAVVDEDTAARIERIVNMADLHLEMGKLIAPPGTNAAEAYAEAVRLQPGNPRGLEGLSAVAEAVVQEARQAIELDDRARARELVAAGLQYVPLHGGLQHLAGELGMETGT
jgi:hypothetical protein